MLNEIYFNSLRINKKKLYQQHVEQLNQTRRLLHLHFRDNLTTI